jgi:phosphatidylserine/phosphatidylglycerophosphate/cardiolipin synthase-like enzyme
MQDTTKGCGVWQLVQEGVHCVADNSPFHMHHKFAIVDSRLLLNGSLNWTVQGVKHNEENVMITTDPVMVRKFKEQFEHLWSKFSGNPVRLQFTGD